MTARVCRQRQRFSAGRSADVRYRGVVPRFPSCLPGRCPLGKVVLLALGVPEERIGIIGFFQGKRRRKNGKAP